MRSSCIAACVVVIAVSAPVNAEPNRDVALGHFKAGIDLIDHKRWRAALEEFVLSRDAYPTRPAAKNIAICLRELGRFDEALDAYRELLKAYPEVAPAERQSIMDDIAQLARFLGEIELKTASGVTIFVDGRERGTTPLEHPLVVAVGTRSIRLVKAGFAPYEMRVTVASGEATRLAAELTVVAEVGRVRVREASGRKADVAVDGVVVGTTPWEGSLSVGEHALRLRGSHDDGADTTARVDLNGMTEVIVPLAKLEGELVVEPTPIDARVRVGTRTSTGTLSVNMPSGTYDVRVDADWYRPKTVAITVSSDQPQRVRVVLDQVRRAYLEVYGGLSLLPTYNAPDVADCGSCIGDYIAVRGGYRITRHIGLELGFEPRWDIARISGQHTSATLFLASGLASVRYEVLERTPITFRATIGFGDGTDPVGKTFWTPVFGPEVDVGYRLGSLGVIVSAGIAGLFFITPSTASTQATTVALAASRLTNDLGFALLPLLTVHGDL
jgi:hypothetical protein